MVLVGVSIEDDPDAIFEINKFGEQVQIAPNGFTTFYATLDGSNLAVPLNTIPVDPNAVGDNNPPGTTVNPFSENLEGLAALGGTVYAISSPEDDSFLNDPGVIAVSPDRGDTIRDLPAGFHFGNDAGFDAVNNSTAYTIKGNHQIANVAIGSQLHKITKFTSTNPQVIAVGKFSEEFADGLAIFNNKFAVASDLQLGDSDGNELYVIRLKDSKITDTTNAIFKNSKGETIEVNGDSGIDFALKGSKVLYIVEDEGNDIFVSEVIKINGAGKFVGSLSAQITHEIINDGGLPEVGAGNVGEFEGLAVIDISQNEFNQLDFQTFGFPSSLI